MIIIEAWLRISYTDIYKLERKLIDVGIIWSYNSILFFNTKETK